MEHNRPDIIITDIRMPIMDGLEMSRIAKEENEELPIIIMSAYNETEYLKASLTYFTLNVLLKLRLFTVRLPM